VFEFESFWISRLTRQTHKLLSFHLFEKFVAFETFCLCCEFVLELTTFFAMNFLDRRSEATRFLCDFDVFLTFWISVDFDARLEFWLIHANVAQWFINFYCWYFENNSTQFFSFSLVIMKLKNLTNNDVMSYLDLEIVSFDDFFEFWVISVRIFFCFEVYEILFHFLAFRYVVDNNTKHQIIIEYCVWERKIDFFKRVFFLAIHASIFLVFCRFWFILCDSDLFAMSHW
jgi:hypothetical protein